jgi:hypothetical protein
VLLTISPVGRVEILLFGHHCPGDVQQFARSRTTRDFRRLACCAQPFIERFDHRIVARRAQRRQIQGSPQASVARMSNACPSAHTTAREALVGRQSGVADRRGGTRAERKVERADQHPSSGEQSDAAHALKPRRCGRPGVVLVQSRRKPALEFSDLLVQCVDQPLQAFPHAGNHHWVLDERVELVAQLRAHIHQPIALHQALVEFGVDLWRWRPDGWL